MSIVHYDGELGSFEYDDNEFVIQRRHQIYPNDPSYSIEYDTISYVGSETDGSKIHIPEGITDCSQMFRNHKFLKSAPKIPEGVTNCFAMFAKCDSLRKASAIPDSVQNCDYMFAGCGLYFTNPPVIPDSVQTCVGMFDSCEFLEEAPAIPNSVKHCDNMLAGCERLRSVPIILPNVETVNDMFDCCSADIQKMGEWNINNRGQDYYKDGPGKQDIMDILNKVSINGISTQFTNSIDGKNYQIGITVPRSYSENGFVHISCTKNDFVDYGSYIDLSLPDKEMPVNVVKNGNRIPTKIMFSDLAYMHEEKLEDYRKTIATATQKAEAVKKMHEAIRNHAFRGMEA